MNEKVARLPIRSLEIQNYGSIKDARIAFTPFTVLVGPNDSGKSLILKALETLSHIASSSALMSRENFQAQTTDLKGKAISLGIDGLVDDLQYQYEIELSESAGTVGVSSERLELGATDLSKPHLTIERQAAACTIRYALGQNREQSTEGLPPTETILTERFYQVHYGPAGGFQRFTGTQVPFETLLRAIESAKPFRLHAEHIGQAVGIGQRLAGRPVEQTGLGVAKAIAELLLNRPEVMERIDRALNAAMPHARGVRVRHVEGSGHYTLEVVTPSGARVPSNMVSDGLLVFLTYLLLLSDPPPILMIEEPETHVHPGLLERIVKFLRDFAYGNITENPVQVIITTHSPVLLNFVQPEEIRVVQRDEQRGTFVTLFQNAPDLQRLLEYQGPGEIWVNLTESYITRGSSTG